MSDDIIKNRYYEERAAREAAAGNIETPFDGDDPLAAAAGQLDALQRRANEALEEAKRANAKVIAAQQLLAQHVARVRGLLVAASNQHKRGVKP